MRLDGDDSGGLSGRPEQGPRRFTLDAIGGSRSGGPEAGIRAR